MSNTIIAYDWYKFNSMLEGNFYIMQHNHEAFKELEVLAEQALISRPQVVSYLTILGQL